VMSGPDWRAQLEGDKARVCIGYSRRSAFQCPTAINFSVRTPVGTLARFTVAKAIQGRDLEFKMSEIRGTSVKIWRQKSLDRLT